MSKPNVWVTRDGDDWVVRREGSERASSRHQTQQGALDAGRATAVR